MDAELEVISPPAGATEFTVGERVYRKSQSLSARRYAIMERLQQEMLNGRDPVEVFKNNKTAFELLNKQQFAQAAVLIHANMTGAARIADMDPSPAIRMFCLFWNYEGEDKKGMTDDQMREKVEDMQGVDVGFLFREAASSVPGFLAAYRLALEASSNEENPKPGSEPTPPSNA
jgi:hypothetical protein